MRVRNLATTEAKVIEGANVSSIDITRNRVQAFASDWIACNIEAGPFSWNDPPIFDRPICQFKEAAVTGGFDEEQLETALGPLPQFIAHAFQKLGDEWRAAEDDASTILSRIEMKAQRAPTTSASRPATPCASR